MAVDLNVVFDRIITSGNPEQTDRCITLENQSTKRWIQITWTHLNARLLSETPPPLPDATLVDSVAHQYATYAWESQEIAAMTRTLTVYLHTELDLTAADLNLTQDELL
ncbi:MAG: hypothetical protein AAFV53_06465 [Myxococcota bacterium]